MKHVCVDGAWPSIDLCRELRARDTSPVEAAHEPMSRRLIGGAAAGVPNDKTLRAHDDR